MPNSRRKIWDLYDLLSEKEVNVCQAWITASVGGKDAMVSKLFRAMQRNREDEQIWKKLYGAEVYNDNRLRNLFHELGKYLEDYIAFQQFRKAPFLRDLYLIKGINRRGLAESFRYFFRKVKQRWERQPIRNSRYYWALYELEGENFHHASKFPRKEKLDYFRDVEGNLERAVFQDLMRNSLFSLNEKGNRTINRGVSKLETLSQKAQELIVESNSIENLYKDIFEFITKDSEVDDLIINRIQDVWDNRITDKEDTCKVGGKNDILNLAILVLNRLSNINNTNPNKIHKGKQFEFYFWMIDQELLMYDGYLPFTHYNNVSTLAIQLKRWNDLESIISKFSILLAPSLKEESQNITKGQYQFYLKNYNSALNLLNRKYKNSRHDLISRFYVLQVHYELGNLEILPYQLKLLKSYIERNKSLTEGSRKRYLNKVYFFSKLCKANNLEEFCVIKDGIEAKKNFPSPSWLIEKCEENIEWMGLNSD